MRLMANDEKVDSYFSAFFDDDEGDDEYFPVEEWKQVGLAPWFGECCTRQQRHHPFPCALAGAIYTHAHFIRVPTRMRVSSARVVCRIVARVALASAFR